MDAIDKLGLLAQLKEESCSLNHGPYTDHEEHQAVNYIIQPVGANVNDIEEVTAREMIVPVCIDCADALHGDEWTLLYCIECHESSWVYRNFAKNRYRHSVLWLRGCPECSAEFGGLYFTDFKGVVKNSLFSGLAAMSAAV